MPTLSLQRLNAQLVWMQKKKRSVCHILFAPLVLGRLHVPLPAEGSGCIWLLFMREMDAY